MALFLQQKDTVGLITVDEIFAAVEGGFREQAAGEVQLPARTTVDSTSGRGWLRLMPAIMNQSGFMGFKAMHSTPGVGVRYVVMLYSLVTGELLAVIDADWLTSRRTAATGAVGVDVLARPDASVLGILGSSAQARSMLEAVSRRRQFKKVKVFSPTPENRKRFADEMGDRLRLEIEPVASEEAAVRSSDVVLSIFRAGSNPVIQPEWLGPGVHLHAGSSVRPESRELANGVWQRPDVIAVDDLVHALESGDGLGARSEGSIPEGKVVGVWEILGGRKPGRQSASDITLFKAVGTGMQDLALAAALYHRAKELGLGTEFADFPRARK